MNDKIDNHLKKIKNFLSKALCCFKKKRQVEDEKNCVFEEDRALDLEFSGTQEPDFPDSETCTLEDHVLDTGFSQTPAEFLGTELYSIINGGDQDEEDKKICELDENHALLNSRISQTSKTQFLDTEICVLEDHVLDAGFSHTPAEFLGSELYSIINGDQDEEEEEHVAPTTPV